MRNAMWVSNRISWFAVSIGVFGWLAHATPAAAGPAPSAPPARPKTSYVWETVAKPADQVNSNVIYLHRCVGSDCTVAEGATDSTASPSKSSLGHGVLSAFSRGDATWATVSSCMHDVFAAFNVQITETNPGAAPHFEIMVGGMPQELGLSPSLGGVSPFSCQSYIPNSVVFVFDVWGDNPEEICATAAQEIAHSFALDHATEPSDPMTYYPYMGRRYFKNAQIQCGSDCDANHRSPLGTECTGTDFQEHPCACGNGDETQNDVQIISALFGGGAAVPPEVKIVTPKIGDKVTGGFTVTADIIDSSPIGSAELRVDGTLIQTVSAAPFTFTGPSGLADGTHTLEVAGYDSIGTPGRARIDVVVGPGCKSATDCPDAGDICIGGRCVAGPDVPGGLGQVCIAATDCKSWQCDNDNGAKFCVEACKPGQCPSGYGCRDDGAGGGICWPGFDESSFGCDVSAGGSPIGGLLVGLSFASLVLRRRI